MAFDFFFLFPDLRSSDELDELSSDVILVAFGVSIFSFSSMSTSSLPVGTSATLPVDLIGENCSRLFGQSSSRICLDLFYLKIKVLICSLSFVVTGGIFQSRHSRNSRTSLINLALFTLYDSSAWYIRGVTVLMSWYLLLVENCSMNFN